MSRVSLPGQLESLLRSEMEKTIYEANLGKDDTTIAERYVIDRIPQMDIAIELGYERSTISRRLKHIMIRLEWTAHKLGYL